MRRHASPARTELRARLGRPRLVVAGQRRTEVLAGREVAQLEHAAPQVACLQGPEELLCGNGRALPGLAVHNLRTEGEPPHTTGRCLGRGWARLRLGAQLAQPWGAVLAWAAAGSAVRHVVGQRRSRARGSELAFVTCLALGPARGVWAPGLPILSRARGGARGAGMGGMQQPHGNPPAAARACPAPSGLPAAPPSPS